MHEPVAARVLPLVAAVGVEELTAARGDVPRVLEGVRDGGEVAALRPAPAVRGRSVDMRGVWVAARQDGGAGGPAHGHLNVGVPEDEALLLYPFQHFVGKTPSRTQPENQREFVDKYVLGVSPK